MAFQIVKRQDTAGDSTGPPSGDGEPRFSDDRDNDNYNGPYYYDRNGEIIRYVVVGVILFLVLFLIFFGMWHAKRRVRQGKEPLWYHRWLIHPKHRPFPGQTYQQSWPQDGSQRAPWVPPGQQYQMQNWNYAPPPPVYSHDAPPGYQPPQGPPPAKGTSGPGNSTAPAVGESWRAA